LASARYDDLTGELIRGHLSAMAVQDSAVRITVVIGSHRRFARIRPCRNARSDFCPCDEQVRQPA
jgi:hypothetical protein